MKYLRNTRFQREFAQRRLAREFNWSSYLQKMLLHTTEEFAKRMSERRISRSDLARMLGTSRSYVSQIMVGLPNLKLSTLFKLSFILGLRPVIGFEPLVKIEATDFKQEHSTQIIIGTSSRITNTRKHEEFIEAD